MKKNYLLSVLFLLLSSYSFAQTRSLKSNSLKNPDATIATPETKNAVLQPALSSADKNQVFEKSPLPVNQKVSPAIFYMENDQPIDQQQYQQRLQQQSRKK